MKNTVLSKGTHVKYETINKAAIYKWIIRIHTNHISKNIEVLKT